MAAAGMAFMFTNVCGYSIIVGFGAGSALCSPRRPGLATWNAASAVQPQLAIHLLLICVITVAWLNTESILLAFDCG